MNEALTNPNAYERIFRRMSEYDLSRFAATSRAARNAVNAYRRTRPNPLESRVATNLILRYMHNLNRSALAQTNRAREQAVNEFRREARNMDARNMTYYFDQMLQLGIITTGVTDRRHTFRNVEALGQPFSYFTATYDTEFPGDEETVTVHGDRIEFAREDGQRHIIEYRRTRDFNHVMQRLSNLYDDRVIGRGNQYLRLRRWNDTHIGYTVR